MTNRYAYVMNRLAAEVTELGQDRKHGVVGGLVRDIIEFRAGHRSAGRPAPDLGQRDADQPRMQLTLSRLPLPAPGAQAAQPGRRLLVQVLSRHPGTFHARQASVRCGRFCSHEITSPGPMSPGGSRSCTGLRMCQP
jgi:hypothetical protein